MNRCYVFAFVAVSFLVIKGWQEQVKPELNKDDSTSVDVGELQEKRVTFLEERVTMAEALVSRGRADKALVKRLQTDVLHAQLEYATTKAERRELLEKLLAMYDERIEIADHLEALGAPRARSEAASYPELDLLLLKSERVRIEIELEKLEQ